MMIVAFEAFLGSERKYFLLLLHLDSRELSDHVTRASGLAVSFELRLMRECLT